MGIDAEYGAMVTAARVTSANYDAMKRFCLWFWERQSARFDKIDLPAEHRPDAVLRSFEQKSMAIAREGVRQGIGDIIEQTQDLGVEDVAPIDAALAAQGLPTLSQIRLQFWSKIAGIMKRESVRTEAEYYALRNVVECMPDADQSKAWSLLGDFESRKAS